MSQQEEEALRFVGRIADNRQSYDKSFITVLERMKEQKFEAVRTSDPSVENPVIDGYKQGHYACILEVMKAFKSYG